MELRQIAEHQESVTLSEFAALSSESKGRVRSEVPCSIRTDFARDRDRIIHSDAFRRLKHKTQMFLSPYNDYYRTRLTHTLEVSQIARTIARALRLNEDLTEAIALGHDLGHTPFGHAGEEILNELVSFSFKHNLHSVRVIEHLEQRNLTYEVKNGIACHCTGGPDAATLEGKIVEISDKIAYVNHDIEDAVRAGILSPEELPYQCVYQLGRRKSERITTLIQSIIEQSLNKNQISMAPEIEKAHLMLRKFMFDSVYTVANSENERAQHITECLYRHFLKHPDNLPESYRSVWEAEGDERAVCDYIASMTDGYAVQLYQKLYIPHIFLPGNF